MATGEEFRSTPAGTAWRPCQCPPLDPIRDPCEAGATPREAGGGLIRCVSAAALDFEAFRTLGWLDFRSLGQERNCSGAPLRMAC